MHKSDAEMEIAGWVMAYFTLRNEALHLALSTTGSTWQPIHDHQPLLRSTVGTGSMRDPYVFGAPDGTFHLLWTDGWRSPAIGHARSDDLIHWDTQQLLPVMAAVPGTRNCWAPECFFDDVHDVYRLIWSSTVDGRAAGDSWNHRIWSATTTDFAHISAPALFFDPGYPVIDATVLHADGRYVMVFKDERGLNRHGTEHKALRVAVGENGSGPFRVVTDLVTPSLTEGPAVFRVGTEWVMIYDHYFDHCYGASRSVDLIHWHAMTGQCRFPPEARHASVVPVSHRVLTGLRDGSISRVCSCPPGVSKP